MVLTIKNAKEAGTSIVIDSKESPYAFMQDDLSNSCARCRSPDRESWRVFREVRKVKHPQAKLLAFLTIMGDLEDPWTIEYFGRRLPVIVVDDHIDKASVYKSKDIKKAELFAQRILDKQVCRVTI